MPRTFIINGHRLIDDGYGHLREIDEHGNPVQYVSQKWVNPDRTRSKETHPYSYDEFFIFGSRGAIKQDGVNAVYSDRLEQWNWDRYQAACRAAGKRFSLMYPDDASKFLTVYYEKDVEAVALAEGCNGSSGYPYWIFWFKT